VIVGHSERRALGESNEIVAKKIGACLKHLLTPIVCIGESLRDESGNYFSFVRTQIEEIFKNIPRSALNKIVIAYEPIWAIGKKAVREATPAESEEMAIFIRKVLSNIYDQTSASQMILLYGGSVNTKNAGEFLKNGGVQGLLVGRESLDAKKFIEIIKKI
jgi:triosephosphate isomerase